MFRKRKSAPVHIRRARLPDVHIIREVVQEFARSGRMLPLSLGEATERLHDFLILEEKGRVQGVVAVHVTWDRMVELRSLAVRRRKHGRGHGKRLVRAALALARRMEATEVFTLTYIPEYFEQFGFVRIDRAALPHKVWVDCARCPKFPNCGEIAMLLKLAPRAAKSAAG